MDPASIIGVVAAAAQFASTVRKLAHLIKEVHAGTEPGPTKRRLIQLETWAEVADKIRDSGEQNDPQTEKIMKQCIPTVEALTNQLGRIQISEGDGRREKTRKALLAHWEKDDIADLFAQLHRDQMTLLTYRSFASEGHFLQKIKDSMGSLLDERLQYSKRDNQSTLESDFLGAIFITDPRDDRSALVHRKTARAEGTCAWITKTDEFLDWMSTTASSPGLMIEGGPGKGKSMIAISLTEFLENLAQTSEAGTESVIYFFCDNRNPRQNNALAVIRCLVWQLCRLRPCLSHYGIKELEARGDAKHLLDSPTAAVETLWRIFISMIADDRAGIVSYVIDGLDECDETSILSVLTKFHELSRGHQALRSKFRFIILSRPLSSRRRALALDIPKVCLDLDLNERDITAFIEQRIDELSRANPRKPWRDSLVKKVKTTLLEKAGGTFLWVGFVTDDLRGKQVFEVKQCLRALPQGLNGIYDRILLNMPRIHRSKIRSLLHWICLAEHPLLKIKLAGLIYDESADDDGASDATSSVASDLGSNATSDTAADTDELEGLLEYCKPLIKIAEDSSVHFVHQSARDYFMRTDRIETPDLDYFIVGNLQHAHEKMALSCIDVIENHAKLLEKATEVPHGQLIRRAPSGSYVYTDESWLRYVVWKERGSTSFDYAAAFWVHHVRCSGKEYHGAATAERILRLIDNENLKQVWFPVYFVIHELGDWMGYEAKASGLRLAMILGLGTTTRLLIQSMSIDDYISISKYHASTTRGEERHHLLKPVLNFDQLHIIDILLDRYDTEIFLRDPSDVLSTAVERQMDGAVKTLLALRPIPREVHGEDLDRALYMVSMPFKSMRRRTDIITEPVNAGANPCATTNNHTPIALVLQWIERRYFGHEIDGQIEVVRLMLERGAGADLKNTLSGETMLHLAASAHNPSLVSLLLEWGAPINAVDSNGRTPLHSAMGMFAKGTRLCKMLITAGQKTAMQDTSDEWPRTATWNIDSRDSQGRTALLLASMSAWPEAIQLLLEAGADPNLRDNNGQGLTTLFIDHMLKEDTYDAIADVGDELNLDWGYHSHRCVTCIKLLQAVVTSWNEQDVWGRTDLHFLAQLMKPIQGSFAKRTYRAGLQVLKLLRSMGIDEDLKDASGKVARDYYQGDVFWRTEEDPLVIDDMDLPSREHIPWYQPIEDALPVPEEIPAH